jgi:hypothetical protein
LNYLASIRQQQQSWGRRALGLFAIVWLNLVLQPCAMALQSDIDIDVDCLHCPPALSEDISSHSTHEADHSGLGTSLCEANASQCAPADDFNYDGRAVKIKDAPSNLPVGIAPPIADIPLENNSSALLDIGDYSYPPGGPPHLNVLYCVYLI